MSLLQNVEKKQCLCGNFYKTDCSTLGINRKKCGMCCIIDGIEAMKEIVPVIYYIVSKSDIQNNDLKDITRNILKNKLSDDIIELGLEDKLLNEICSILDKDSSYMIEVRNDLSNYLKEYDNINDLIKRLLLKQGL
ncbi:MAG: hypothetical protein RSA57_03920 [Cetobacterium sp.]|uniref:hypothetical protein n=1 Tax=Bacteria TaxID=2 RepID=UPI002FC7F132